MFASQYDVNETPQQQRVPENNEAKYLQIYQTTIQDWLYNFLPTV